MANYLLLGTANENWRIPANVSIPDLLEELAKAAESGVVVRVPVEMNDDPLNSLMIGVNPRALGWWAVYEKEDPDS